MLLATESTFLPWNFPDFIDDTVDSVDDDDDNDAVGHATSSSSRNIDLIDLQFRPNDEDSLRILNCRKTQKLISADIRSVSIFGFLKPSITYRLPIGEAL